MLSRLPKLISDKEQMNDGEVSQMRKNIYKSYAWSEGEMAYQ